MLICHLGQQIWSKTYIWELEKQRGWSNLLHREKVYPAAATAGKGSCGTIPSQVRGIVVSKTVSRKQNRWRNGARRRKLKAPRLLDVTGIFLADRRTMGDSKDQLTCPGPGWQLDLMREAGAVLKWQRDFVAIRTVFCGNASKSVLWPRVDTGLNYLFISKRRDGELKNKLVLELWNDINLFVHTSNTYFNMCLHTIGTQKNFLLTLRRIIHIHKESECPAGILAARF